MMFLKEHLPITVCYANCFGEGKDMEKQTFKKLFYSD